MISENYVAQIASMIGSTITESASTYKVVKFTPDHEGESWKGELEFTGPEGSYAFEYLFNNGRMHGEEIDSWELFKGSKMIASHSSRNMSDEADAAAQFAYEYVDANV